jgi:hypothetical protein
MAENAPAEDADCAPSLRDDDDDVPMAVVATNREDVVAAHSVGADDDASMAVVPTNRDVVAAAHSVGADEAASDHASHEPAAEEAAAFEETNGEWVCSSAPCVNEPSQNCHACCPCVSSVQPRGAPICVAAKCCCVNNDRCTFWLVLDSSCVDASFLPGYTLPRIPVDIDGFFAADPTPHHDTSSDVSMHEAATASTSTSIGELPLLKHVCEGAASIAPESCVVSRFARAVVARVKRFAHTMCRAA